MSVDIVKESKDISRIPKESKTTPGDLDKDDAHDLPKVDGEKVTRRRSVRLQEKWERYKKEIHQAYEQWFLLLLEQFSSYLDWR